MKPDKPGIWEWFDEYGTKRLVEVCDCAPKDKGYPQYLRVYWWGGYYNVNDEVDNIYDTGCEIVEEVVRPSEWADNWGNRVAGNGELPGDQLYLGPTPEQFQKLKENGLL